MSKELDDLKRLTLTVIARRAKRPTVGETVNVLELATPAERGAIAKLLKRITRRRWMAGTGPLNCRYIKLGQPVGPLCLVAAEDDERPFILGLEHPWPLHIAANGGRRGRRTLLDEALEVIAKRPHISLEELAKALGRLWLPEALVMELGRQEKLKD
jgi:hypothetical protein